MQIFTIRKSLHKIKLWNNVRVDSNIYQALLTTRDIEYSDLYVYVPSFAVNYLPHAYNFEYGENETLENATVLRFYNLQHRMDNITKLREWNEAEPATFDRAGYEALNLYTEGELDDIEFNLAPENIDAQRDIPLKEFSKLEEVEEKVFTISIPVTRITE